VTSRAGFVDRVIWRLLRLLGFKQKAWDQQFKKGLWSRGPHSEFFLNKVASLCRGGVLVEFGCAEGILANELPAGVFSMYYGFDVSEVAVKVATDQVSEHRASYCVFEQCEMSLWKGSSGVSLILLEECLCYLNIPDTKKFLELCKRSLIPGGSILVVDHSAEKHSASFRVCRAACHVIDEVVFGGRTYLTLS
jgi:2-polyprenyl-3-methyl-5-hydroxy-6-metoxy-1,4-benzoquinol methylase